MFGLTHEHFNLLHKFNENMFCMCLDYAQTHVPQLYICIYHKQTLEFSMEDQLIYILKKKHNTSSIPVAPIQSKIYSKLFQQCG